MNEPSLVEVFRAKNSAQAHFMVKALADTGIQATIENENLRCVLGEVPAWNAAPRIMAEASDAAIARAMLVALERSKPAGSDEGREESTCLACGGRMQDEDEQCPKCGWSYQADEPVTG